MSNYIIIDSNKLYAAKLYKELTGSDVDADECIIDTTNFANASKVFDALSPKIKDDSGKIILINAESELQDKYLQHQPIIELLFWIRCRFNNINPVVFYSGVSVNHSLKQTPENYILLSPNCYYYQLPITKSKIETIKNLKPIADVDLKPYLKPAINLEQVRHRYANYAGMALMTKVARGKHKKQNDKDILESESLKEFTNSLDYYLLKKYFNLSFKGLSAFSKDEFVPQTKKVLLVDDLASEGWQTLISQMLYGKSDATEIDTVKIYTKNKTEFDETKTIVELEKQIKKHKPHLILLDLRLNDEEGKKHLSELGGFKLLSHLKKSHLYKGVPVIMFTASSNAQTVKQLIGNGSYCVWTKPGIDEGLSVNGIIKRYDQLLQLVTEVFTGIDTSNLATLNNNVKADKNTLSFEEMREDLLNQARYIRYRSELQEMKQQNHYFNSFTDIFIDTNSLMSGENYNNGNSFDFAETILNIYKLAQICRPQEHIISVNGNDKKFSVSRLIVLNFVIDEIIEKTKINDDDQPKNWKRALLGYSVIRALFDNNKNIRTEFCYVDSAGTPKTKLQEPVKRHYADPVIMKEIIQIVSGNNFAIKQGSKNINACYKTADTNVLLICNENPKKKKKGDNLPKDLMKKYNDLKNQNKGKIEILRLVEFNKKMKEILL